MTGVIVRRGVTRHGIDSGRERLGTGGLLALMLVAAVLATAVLGTLGLVGIDGSSTWRRASTGARVEPSPSPSPSPSVSPPYRRPPNDPTYPVVTHTAVELRGGRSDLFLPLAEAARRPRRPLPIVLMVADPGVDPSQYEQFAHDVAGYGLAVLVTDRRASSVVAEVATWAHTVAAEPDAFAHGQVGRTVSFVVAHADATALLTRRGALPRSVRARVFVAPTSSVENSATVRRVTVPGASSVLDVTNDGRRSARTQDPVRERRLRTIMDFARPRRCGFLRTTATPSRSGTSSRT